MITVEAHAAHCRKASTIITQRIVGFKLRPVHSTRNERLRWRAPLRATSRPLEHGSTETLRGRLLCRWALSRTIHASRGLVLESRSKVKLLNIILNQIIATCHLESNQSSSTKKVRSSQGVVPASKNTFSSSCATVQINSGLGAREKNASGFRPNFEPRRLLAHGARWGGGAGPPSGGGHPASPRSFGFPRSLSWASDFLYRVLERANVWNAGL